MSLYEDHVLPHLINCACGAPQILKLRSQLVPKADGVVLEVGMGSGINLEFYDPERVAYVWGLEPSRGMRRKANGNLKQSPVDVRWLDLPGEQIPLPDQSIDTVLLTFTLCTIPDTSAALSNIRRVLKPGGKILFCEHGLAKDSSVRSWQNRLNGVWSKLAGGCQLNRSTPQLLTKAGFELVDLREFYTPNTPKLLGYVSMGQAFIKD